MSVNLAKASEWATILGVAGGFVTGCFYAARWFIMWMWRVDKAVRDVSEIKENHLKHIYHALRLIGGKLEIDVDDQA